MHSRRQIRNLRLGYILKMFPRLSETFILNEILELEKQGVEFQIFSLRRPADAVFHEHAKLVRSRISYLPKGVLHEPFRVFLSQLHVGGRYGRYWWRALRNALRRVRAEREIDALTVFCQACCVIREMPELGHVHAHYANLPAKLALLINRITGISYSITTHAKDIFQGNPFSSPKMHERFCRARFVVANSRFSAEHIRRGLNGNGEIHSVYNGLDLGNFPMRQNEPGEPVILSVGRLVAKKGFSDLVTACQLLKQRGVKFTCELVGTGLLSSQLEEQINGGGLGDRVKLIGPLPQHLLRERLERAMVFTLACIQAADGDRDILPNVIKEAMAVGVPVVTTSLDGIEELIEDGSSGLLTPPGDPVALAEKIEALLANAPLRLRLALQGRKVIEERFDRRTNFARLKTLLNDALLDRLAQPSEVMKSYISCHDTNSIR